MLLRCESESFAKLCVRFWIDSVYMLTRSFQFRVRLYSPMKYIHIHSLNEHLGIPSSECRLQSAQTDTNPNTLLSSSFSIT